jgi:hypothetical protein
MPDSVVLEFGSRSGSWFALAFFTAIFGTLGWGVAREIRLRANAESGMARVLGLALMAGPVALVYASSLSGFYEAEVHGPILRFRYLIPGVAATVLLADVVDVRPIPGVRGRLRLQVTDRNGRAYESATWDRASIAESAGRLRKLLPRSLPRRERVRLDASPPRPRLGRLRLGNAPSPRRTTVG